MNVSILHTSDPWVMQGQHRPTAYGFVTPAQVREDSSKKMETQKPQQNDKETLVVAALGP